MPSESWLRRHSISYIGAFLDTLLPPKTVILPISIVLLFSLWGLAPTFALEKYGRPLPSMPAVANRAAKGGPAWPVPMMMASKCRDTGHLLL